MTSILDRAERADPGGRPERNGRPPRPADGLGAALPDVPDSPAERGGGLCRLTVVADGEGVRGRVDLAVPGSTTPGELMPVLFARMAEPDQAAAADRWVLQRLGEGPLADRSLDALDVLDGEVLHLRPAADPLPPLRYDDVADGIADAIAERPDRWTPEASRRMLLTIAVLTLAAAVSTGVVAVPFALLGWSGLGIAALAVAGGLVLLRVAGGAREGERHRPARLAGLVAVWSGVVLAFPSGLVSPGGVIAGLAAPGLLALVALLVGRTASVSLGVVTGLSVTGLAVLAIDVWGGLGLDRAAAIMAVALFLVASVGPRLAARVFGLRVPELPRNADELQTDIEPLEADSVVARTGRADGLVTVILVATGASAVATAGLLHTGDGWAARLLPLLLAAASALRGAVLLNRSQRTSVTLCGLVAGLVMVHGFAVGGSPSLALTLTVLVLLGTAGALLAAWRLTGRRLRPIWGRLVEIAELLVAIALVPVLLQLLGVYAHVRGMNG